jgi:hypothetical protein
MISHSTKHPRAHVLLFAIIRGRLLPSNYTRRPRAVESSTAMGALEEPHLVAAACACEEEEEDDLELLAGEGEAAAADAIEPAVRALLLGLGEDKRREGLRRTPRRVAKAFRDGTRGTAHVPASLLPAPARPPRVRGSDLVYYHSTLTVLV